ncbi:hypothetical protein BD626DRAFT_486079, partial [Schizophyllum amplum]
QQSIGLRFSTIRHSSASSKQWSRYPSFFVPTPIRRYSLLKTALWVVPLTTGLALHFAPRPKSTVPNFFASPGLIPCRTANELPDVPPRKRKREILKERLLRFWTEMIWEPILTARRFAYLCCLFVPVILCSPMLLVGEPDKKLKDERWGAVWWYNLLVYMMEAAGPAFIKLAQWAASLYRATLNPALYPIVHRRRRQAKTAPVAAITPVIPPSVLPIEMTSRAPDTAVAIKVLHPRVFGADNLLTFENNFAPRNWVEWSTRELLVEEYRPRCLLNMLLLDNFVHSDLHPGNIMVRFNKPLSGRTLMVNAFNRLLRQYVPSLAPPLPAAIVEPNADSDAIVTQLRSVAHSLPEWHAALDNLNQEGYIPELIFLDAGLVTTLNSKNRQNFLDLFRAVAEFDGYRTGQLMIERCRTPHLAVDAETFALRMQHIVLSVKRKTFSLGQIKISDILTEVLKAVRQHHVKMEGDFVNTVISILLLEAGGQMARADGPGLSTRDLPRSNLAALLKVWVWLEAREFISSAIVNADEMIKYDWLAPNI